MKNVFERIKAQVPIRKYIQQEMNSTISTVGDCTHRANPCPICGHNDCFTIYDQNQTYHCFSCGAAGDIFHLERHLKNQSSNFEAVQSLANRYGIKTHIQTLANASGHKKANPISHESPSSFFPQRQREVRAFVTEYYHQQLLKNPTALHYQMHERGHSLDVLQHFKIGLAGGDLIGQATKYGFGIEELEGIGLVKKYHNGYRPYIPNGFFVFPHWSAGEILFSTLKDPTGQKKFQIPKKFATPEWLCLNQDALNQKVIIVVEGENDFLSVVDKAKQTNVVATIGNFNTTTILDFISKNSTDKTFFLLFDQDEAGAKYTSRYADAITKGGGKAYKINISPPCKDIDEYLRAVDDPKVSFTKLFDEAILLTSNTPQEYKPLFNDFISYEVLGELGDGLIVLWSKVNRKIYIVSLKDLTLDKLDQIGGGEILARVSRKPEEGKISFRVLKRAIITEAAKTQLGSPEYLGQGIHQLNNGNLLIVNGGEAWIWDGEKGAKHESPLV